MVEGGLGGLNIRLKITIKMTKNSKYLESVVLVTRLCLVIREGVDRGLNSVFGHIH